MKHEDGVSVRRHDGARHFFCCWCFRQGTSAKQVVNFDDKSAIYRILHHSYRQDEGTLLVSWALGIGTCVLPRVAREDEVKVWCLYKYECIGVHRCRCGHCRCPLPTAVAHPYTRTSSVSSPVSSTRVRRARGARSRTRQSCTAEYSSPN